MIIADEDDVQKDKDQSVPFPPVRYPERAASRRSLPDYETSQALAFGGVNDSQSTLYKPPPRRRLLDSRVWRAIIVSLVVYILLTIIIGVPIIVHKELEDESKYSLNQLAYLDWDRKPSPFSGPISNGSAPPPGIYPICSNWTTVEYRQDSNSSFVLALAEHSVSPHGQFCISSNASSTSDITSIQGAFYAGVNPDQTVQDAVLSIMMQASSPGVFNHTSSCLALADNFTDLALLTPSNLASSDNILWNITLLFPQSTTPSQVDSFATYLPMFDQRLSSFGGNVDFHKVSIQGDVSRVTVDSIQARKIIVDTSLEPVTGTFQVNESLSLSTVMAPIVANISLYNNPTSEFSTTLDLHTGNSNLTANVTVLAPNKQLPSRPDFVATLSTFSGILSTSFLHDPSSPPTVIQLHALNDLGPIDATLDGLFQGTFQVSTKQAAAYVSQGSTSIQNPWMPGQGRTLQILSNYTARSYGWIGWGEERGPEFGFQDGQITIDTSLSDATLSFLG